MLMKNNRHRKKKGVLNVKFRNSITPFFLLVIN